MGFWKRLFSGGGAADAKAAERRLAEAAFLVTADGVEPPTGEMSPEQAAFLPRLREGRQKAIAFRRAMMADMERQAAAQGFPGVLARMMKDPVDDPCPGWHSLGILFDWDKMDGSYGPQAMRLLFRGVSPEALSSRAVLHFGDLIQFDSYCAIVARSQSATDLARILDAFGAELQGDGLLPHAVRFLRGAPADGHVIPCAFALPIQGELYRGVVTTDPKTGSDWILTSAIEGTAWKKR